MSSGRTAPQRLNYPIEHRTHVVHGISAHICDGERVLFNVIGGQSISVAQGLDAFPENASTSSVLYPSAVVSLLLLPV